MNLGKVEEDHRETAIIHAVYNSLIFLQIFERQPIGLENPFISFFSVHYYIGHRFADFILRGCIKVVSTGT
jgi:hypothetical protein